MPTTSETKAALSLVSDRAVGDVIRLAGALTGSPALRRAAMLELAPAVIGAYSEGSAALAADYYEERRQSVVGGSFQAAVVVPDRTVRIRRGVAWASEPWVDETPDVSVDQRFAEIVGYEVVRPFWDTMLTNRRADPAAVGWRRIASGGCGFCQLLADRGAVYTEATVRFAAHPNCRCVAEPVFQGEPVGERASALQYVASKRRRTEAEKAEIRRWVAFYEGR